MREYSIDLSGVTAREDLHLRLREALPLPEWYGDNLDALYDALTDLEDPAIICITGWKGLREALPSYFIRFARVLEDASAQAEGLFVSFETEKEAEEEAPGKEAEEEASEETEEEDSLEPGEEADKTAETEESGEPVTEAAEDGAADEEDRESKEAESAVEADEMPEDVEEEVWI